MPRLVLVALLLLPSTAHLNAQSTNAGITGRVSDPSKAVIDKARVAAINAATNLRYETVTGASGEYSLTNLPAGTYRIEVDKVGFKRLVKPDVELHVQDALEIDFEMTLGAASETVNVEAGAPLVNAESGTVSTVVDRAFVENLPLNGRSFQTLIALTPGVVVTVTGFQDQGQFSVNGQRADGNYFTVDGVSANFGVTGYQAMVQTASGALPALSALGGTNSLVSVDAMQEFRIQTSSFAPEFGRTPGGQVSILTRSGTNAFHGALFEYFRNDVLDARDWFVNYNGLPKPAERQNDFGGVLGGPILKNKSFFFFSYEGLRLRQPATQQSFVPDAAARQAAPSGIQLFLNAFPVANGPEVGAGMAQYNAGYSNPSSLDAASFRVDQILTPRLTLFARYNYSPSNLDQRSPPLGGPVLSLTEKLTSYVHTGTIGFTQLITPRISNEVRANYSNQSEGTFFQMDHFGGAVPPPDSLLFPPGTTSATGFYGFYIPSIGEWAQGKAAIDEQRQMNFIDNLAVTRGGHQMKFGVDYRWLAPLDSTYAYRAFIEFTSFGANPGGVNSSIPASANTQAQQSVALLSRNFSLYGQDTWKITPRLTLTYGLRWDVNPALKGKNAASDPFTLTDISSTGVNPATVALAPRGTSLYQTTWGNVAPRLGIAYQIRERPGRETILRGGFGIFYDLGQGSLGGASFYFPFSNFKILPASTTFPLSPANAAPPPITTNLPVSTILVADPNLALPRTYQWNIGLEQSLGRSQILSLTYIGAIGRDLLRVTQIANLTPNFPNISLTTGTATSDYYALQAKFQRRLARGFEALASYSFSHSIDSASTDAFATRLNTPGALANPNVDRGDSDFDIRHSFSAGVTYNLPAPGSSGLARTALGGWSLDSFALARSAPPVDVVGATFNSVGISLMPRPNLNPGVPLEPFGPGYPGGKTFNKRAFTAAPAGTQGDFGRNVLRGFDAAQADLGLQRVFRVTETVGLRLRGEFFNILNHPNFANPTNLLTSGLFGRSTQTLANGLGSGGANGGFNPLYQIGGPRSIQLALKLQF
ncbi:MAG TPA: TonB-dependent receptor [Bryobacteraceae bacterium]|nr:TonB-dependent receptor [Bryobacteraceae bacterium]